MVAVVPLDSLSEILKRRGILESANDANWEAFEAFGGQGWRYPVFNRAGIAYEQYRWKNADSHGNPKYSWIFTKPAKVRYYLLRDTIDAIKSSEGYCYLASGEPDVLAYRAAGIKNVLCWFDGESSIPETLAEDLSSIGVEVLLHYPDRDLTGMRSCSELFYRLQDTQITYLPCALNHEVEDKGGYDINALWIDSKFDALVFREKLSAAPELDESVLLKYKLVESEKPTVRKSATNETIDASKLPEAFKQRIIQDIESQKGFKRWKANGFANFNCPFHDDQHPSAGYNRDTHNFKCLGGCGEMNAKEYGEKRGIFLRDYYEKPEKKETVVQSTVINSPVQFMSSRDAVIRVVAELNGESIPEHEPMEFPFKIYHQFGGFAQYMWQGKLVYISGVSGGGKTSWGETFANEFLKQGKDVIWFGPEWSADEMVLRNLQRLKGMSVNDFAAMRVFRSYERRGTPLEQCKGHMPAKAAIDRDVSLLENILKWKGEAHYIQPGEFDLNLLLEQIEIKIDCLREQNRQVSALFFDYLQRAPGGGRRDWGWGELVASRVKSLCERKSLFGFMFIQPRKSDSRGTRDGNELNESSGQGISDQQCNLYFTITPIFKDGEKQDFSKVSIVKNSMGRTGWLYQRSPLKHLTWIDEEIPKNKVDTKSYTEATEETPF